MHPIHIVLSVLGLVISALVASGKHRNVVGWSLFGLFLPVIAIIAVCCVSTLPAKPQQAA